MVYGARWCKVLFMSFATNILCFFPVSSNIFWPNTYRIRIYSLKDFLAAYFRQVRCVQFWCHPMGTGNYENPLGWSKCFAGSCSLALSFFPFLSYAFVSVWIEEVVINAITIKIFSCFFELCLFPFGKVVGVVGFMDRRLDLPEGLDPHISSIIKECWIR